MDLRIQLTASDLSDEALQERTRQLGRALNQQSGVQASLVQGEADAAGGNKGDLVTLGTLALAFVSSGALKAVLEILKAFLEQRGGKTRKVEVGSDKGSPVTVTLADLAPTQLEATIARLQALAKPNT